jgi:hypothetical protein
MVFFFNRKTGASRLLGLMMSERNIFVNLKNVPVMDIELYTKAKPTEETRILFVCPD